MQLLAALLVLILGAVALTSAALPRWQQAAGACAALIVAAGIIYSQVAPTTLVYIAACSDPDIRFADCTERGGFLMTAKPQTFRVNVAARTVLRTGGPFGTRRYADCTVLDRQNWACPLSRDAGWIAMEGGRYSTTLRSTVGDEVRTCRRFSQAQGQVSASYWQYLRLTQLVTQYLVQPLRSLPAIAASD